MENPIKMDDLGVPLFLETPIYVFPLYIIEKNRGEYLSVSCWFLGGFQPWLFDSWF